MSYKKINSVYNNSVTLKFIFCNGWDVENKPSFYYKAERTNGAYIVKILLSALYPLAVNYFPCQTTLVCQSITYTFIQAPNIVTKKVLNSYFLFLSFMSYANFLQLLGKHCILIIYNTVSNQHQKSTFHLQLTTADHNYIFDSRPK